MLAKPVYHGVEVKNSFVPPIDKTKGPIVMTGPIYNAVSSEHKCSMIPEKADLPLQVSHPVLPANFQHKYNPFEPRKELDNGMLGPIYDVPREHHFREIISNALILSDLVYKDKDMSHNVYCPEAPNTEAVKTLLGPVYEILNEHHYNQINAISNELKTLQNPVYVPEARHAYSEITKHVEQLEKLEGPVYNVKRDHHFREIFKQIDHVKKLQGPIYDLNLPKHHFNAIDQHMEAIKELKGPIYDVESKSHFNGIIKHVEELKALQGPIYSLGPIGHKYTGDVLEPPAIDQKTLHGPKYDIDNQHQFSEIIAHANKLKDMTGPVYNLEERTHHFRELTKHVEGLAPLAKPILVGKFSIVFTLQATTYDFDLLLIK